MKGCVYAMHRYMEEFFENRVDAATDMRLKNRPSHIWLKSEQFNEYCETLLNTLSREQGELFEKLRSCDLMIQNFEKTECYKAGWFDGILVGVLAATREPK